MALVAARPSISGIWTSMRMQSKLCDSSSARACGPDSAAETVHFRFSSRRLMSLRFNCSSSTTRRCFPRKNAILEQLRRRIGILPGLAGLLRQQKIQGDAEVRSFSFPAGDRDVSAKMLNEFVNDGQPEADSLAFAIIPVVGPVRRG